MNLRQRMIEVLGPVIVDIDERDPIGLCWMDEVTAESSIAELCIPVFEKAKELIDVCDPLPAIVTPILEAVDITCSHFYFGSHLR